MNIQEFQKLIAAGKPLEGAEMIEFMRQRYPIWWDLCPRVVNTWIENQQIKGKTIIPFATSGGSSITNRKKRFANFIPN